MTRRIGFVGCGKMATALARGIRNAGLVASDQLFGSDVDTAAAQTFAEQTGATLVPDNRVLVHEVDVIVLAVKPHQLDTVLRGISDVVTSDHLLISIAAGVRISRLCADLGRQDQRVVRVMPNTPALVGAGATGFAVGGGATDEDIQYVDQLFESVGVAERVPESMLDVVTGLSGSGPAYLYLVIEALADGGVREGLPRDVALRLAAQTVLGAARMVLETGKHPGILKDQVTSPGGTTITGLAVLENRAIRGAFIDAVHAATHRSHDLG